ncbi:hypothetical protein JZU69_01545, partial [bacterium]|nr:hypothetical protein [bacterium]
NAANASNRSSFHQEDAALKAINALSNAFEPIDGTDDKQVATFAEQFTRAVDLRARNGVTLDEISLLDVLMGLLKPPALDTARSLRPQLLSALEHDPAPSTPLYQQLLDSLLQRQPDKDLIAVSSLLDLRQGVLT